MSAVKLAFTSCMDAEEFPEQPVWRAIAAQQPDALFLLGDQIYMDWNLSPKWKRIFVGDPDGPKRFADDMHKRYALQWGVADFRALVAQVVQNKGQDRILVTWDEHDMAWNNAFGEARDDGSSDPISDKKHGVPKLARDIAKLLFEQFVGVLRAGHAGAAYPSLPANILSPPSATRGVQQALAIGGIDTVVLDQRFYRTARDHPNARLLGPGQLDWLKAKVSQGTGLVVVAGSSPLVHRYFLSNQAWDDEEQPYPDFRRFVNAVSRPVLYVGGDIHRTAYTGLLPHTNIVQVLASGAARGDAWKAVPGSFAIAEIDLAQRSTKVTRHSSKGTESPDLARFDDHGWMASAGGLAEKPDAFPTDALPLFTAVLRRHGQVPANCAPEALDELFRDRLPKQVAAEALEVHAQGTSVSLQLAGGQAALQALCKKAAAQARAQDRQSLVLFVHAFNKPMAASVEQGLDLRKRYPGCEPLLFSWPSGDHAGLINFHSAQSNADDGAAALAALLPTFIQAAREAGLTSVLFVRSLGARMVLRPELASAAQGLDRIVLSAPAVPEAGHAAALDAMGCTAFVTINRDDATLKKLPWSGPPLGNHRPQTSGQRTLYIDCTDVDDSGTSHDYFLDGGHGPALQSLHERLLYGQAVSATHPAPGFVAQDAHLLVGG
ncbi:alkaline phosphatase D family protein [Aquabacterium sp.]|uniref:alkaline phosphatase D family protein n=1 Tax=Aquabacterium sp. TaxID=1872578 RepID=UPI002C992604|nr:alkaline phosphatase D family protein [Aquabacterium sp.]HSW07065.1 alkaline phosphatase D family protein [Aquabacterium sp.]